MIPPAAMRAGRVIRAAVLAFPVVAALWAAAPAAACPDAPALLGGERLAFDISWLDIPAGRATLAIEERVEVGGRLAVRIVSTAESNKFVDVFYKVRDRAESIFDCKGRYSHHFLLRSREGKRRRERDYAFDLARQEVRLEQPGAEVRRFPLVGPVQDPLSILYAARTQPLEVGRPVFLSAFEGSRRWDLEVHVLRRERVTVPAGSFDTIVVKPLLKFEGVFQQKGDVVVWLTDDARRMPVRMESQVKIGSVAAELTSYGVSEK